MRPLGIIIAIVIGAILIYLSKWLFLVCLVVSPFILMKFTNEIFKCPACENIQKEHVILASKINSKMTHGRITKSGRVDKRYNTEYRETEIIEFGVQCKKCSNTFKTIREFKL
jgi:ABC-type bacteriocin/lantibiotic exporter with double-glycine peptidase domain